MFGGVGTRSIEFNRRLTRDAPFHGLVDILDRPISPLASILGWCVATGIFVELVAFKGGFGLGDTYESVFSTWAIQHGQVACAFPSGFRVTAPLYPLLSGAIAAVERIGHTSPFPYVDVRGPDCARSFLAINSWSLRAQTIEATVRIALLGWVALLAGVTGCIRAFGRGNRLWEPTTLLVAAVIPPVSMSVVRTFHPEDLLAMGVGLCAVAAAKRGWWWSAGLFVALAALSQQFALLIAIPLLIVAPSRRERSAYLIAAIGTSTMLLASLMRLGSHGSIHAVMFGTGNTGGIGGTILWELHPRGTLLLVLSRFLPLVVSACFAIWLRARLPSGALLEAAPLCSLIAVSLGLRLVFEQQVFGYYYMPLAVALVLLSVAEHRIRVSAFVWLATLSLAYDQPFSNRHENVVILGFTLCVALLVALRTHRKEPRWSDVGWAALLAISVLISPAFDPIHFPSWILQLAFVPTGIAIASRPLFGYSEVRPSVERRSVAPVLHTLALSRTGYTQS